MNKRFFNILTILILFQHLSFGTEKKIKIEFFQNKPEAVLTFNKLIAEFEKENPDIDIEQNNTLEPDIVLKTRIATGDTPEIMALNGSKASYGDIALMGVFKDFTNEDIKNRVIPEYLKIISDLHSGKKGLYGIPYSANAATVLYNKDKFREFGVKVPNTWDEFIKICEKIKKDGKVPFYHTYKEAWTLLVPFNILAANIQGESFIKDKKAGIATFADRYSEVADKMEILSKYGHKLQFSSMYDDGNRAFAKGESVMYIQGIWAINAIVKYNPKINIGAFVMPVTNIPEKNFLVSGVDTILTMSKNAKYPKESMRFINFLLEKKTAKSYIDEQRLFSAVKGVEQNDNSLKELKEWFKDGRLKAFPDHSYPAGLQPEYLIQEFIFRQNKEEFLKKFDMEWDKLQKR